MPRGSGFKAEDIECRLHMPKNMEHIYEAQADFITVVYKEIIEKLKRGKIDRLLRDLLSDEDFKKCFGIDKEKAEEYIE